MPAYFNEGFAYREASWHRQETLLMERLTLPEDREEAMLLAGHDFDIVERQNGNVGRKLDTREQRDAAISEGRAVVFVGGEWHTFDLREEKKGLYIRQLRKDADGNVVPGPVHGNHLEVVNSSMATIPNSIGWDLLEIIAGEGAKLETGMTLKDGALCVVTVYLDEPFQLPGDDSVTLPYIAARWAHDGSGALSTRSFMTRIVCANTDAIAEGEAKKLGTDFTFRHTKNWKEKVEDAKLAIRGLRTHAQEFVALSEELAEIKVTPEQRELFVTELLPMPPQALISERVMQNVEEARAKVRATFDGPTIPEAHKLTGYGLRLAGVEYLDHLRGYRDSDTYVGRQLLKTEPAKTKLTQIIKDCVAA